MTLLQSLFSPRNAGPESTQFPLTSPTLAEWFGGPQSLAKVAVNQQTVAGIPAAWRAVRLISGVSSSLPLHCYRKDGATRMVLAAGPAAEFLEQPHPDLTRFELSELLYASLAFQGDAVFRKLRDGSGRLRELWFIPADKVQIGRDPTDLSKVYVIDGDLDRPLTDREIWHVPGFGFDGVRGQSLIRLFRESLSLPIAMEKYGAKLFGSGTLASGFLSTDRQLTSDQAKELKGRWQATIGRGLEGAHEPAVLGAGAKWNQITINPEDAQFLDSRRFSVQEISRMFGPPPHLLMDTSASTSWGTGIESMTLGWVKFSLQPDWLTRVEQRWTKLLRDEFGPTRAPAGQVPDYAGYSLEGLLRGDSNARATFYRQLWEFGGLSTNEIRALEDMGPIDGGDQHFRPLNFGALADLGAGDPGAVEDPRSPRALSEMVQKIYLGVGKVVSAEEARAILNRAGADLTGPAPEPAAPAMPAVPAIPAADPEGVPTDA